MTIFVTSENDQLAKERLAHLLKSLRGQTTQREFAKVLGTSYTALQDWEKEIRLPREKNLRRIAQLKGWTQDQLLRYLVAPERSPSSPQTFHALTPECQAPECQDQGALTNPVEAIYAQIQSLSPQQLTQLRDCLNLRLSGMQGIDNSEMARFLNDRQKHNLHLLLKASLTGQSPEEAMAKSGINPELFTDVFLRNDTNRSVDYAALEKFSGLCCRVVGWRGDQPPLVKPGTSYTGQTALLCHDLAGNSGVPNELA